jgi:hypothetical protein
MAYADFVKLTVESGLETFAGGSISFSGVGALRGPRTTGKSNLNSACFSSCPFKKHFRKISFLSRD